MIKWVHNLLFTKQSNYYDSHYSAMEKQPIEIMQERLTHHEFIGFLKGNYIKYDCRAGHKQGESYAKDIAKRDRYAEWLKQAQAGQKIDPRV